MIGIVATDARNLTDRIKIAVEGAWQLIIEAYQSRAWATLGYGSWDEYCTREFGTSRLKLPREDRPERIASMRESGMSLRAIETATGVSKTTIIKDLREVVQSAPPAPEPAPALTDEPGQVTKLTGTNSAPDSYWSPEESFVGAHPLTGEVIDAPEPEPIKVVTGLDGKSYPKAAPSEPRRRSLVDDAYAANMKLWEAIERIRTITGDDRFTRNKADILAAIQPSADLALEVLKNLVTNEGEK